ncbi:tumor necrosis factor receptor superfamily member 5 isoform X2 [Labrus bergylta]|uniref:Tumor necrosis factor receptor superfamily member 5-like n=1 Tax=Labrus bergylta TaxID=56723 RepID=A0A3Q3F821_9LABR|nr:tumor necrosis factor receptor superfamily member 5-like isoform X2 [Labrus bergylta]
MRPGSAATFLILLMIVFTGQTFSCDKYTYEINDRCCRKCPPGGQVHEDCTELISTLCKPCTEGTFMDQPTSRRECYRCTNCEGSGLQIKMLCTLVSDTVCEPLEGFYCSDSRKDNCVEAKKHRRCEPGEYIKENGTSSTDTVCSTCSDGTFSDGTFTSCQKHKQCESEGLTLLTSGTKTENAQCGGLLSLWTGLIVGAVVMFLLIVLGMFCLGWWIRKHSGQRSQEAVNTEDVVLEMEDLKSDEEPKVVKGELKLVLALSRSSPGSFAEPYDADPLRTRSHSLTDIELCLGRVEFIHSTNTLARLFDSVQEIFSRSFTAVSDQNDSE